MRYVLTEYLSSLKEDGELDSFVTELLQSMKYIPLTKIQKGRQYGVDLPAIGTDDDGQRKLFLFVIKQGNFSRRNWDSGHENDIRPSIMEIFDVYLNTRIQPSHKSLPIKIVVCCNGDKELAVEETWAQFINNNSKENIEFDFWGVKKLVQEALSYQMNEDILSDDLLLTFKRALSFIDLPDYDLSHFYSFLNSLLPQDETNNLSEKKVIKRLRLVNLCQSLVSSWCEKSNNLKPSYIASERIVLATYNWLLNNSFIEKEKVILEFYSILQNWRLKNHKYAEKVVKYTLQKDGLSIGVHNHDEYCLTTFEQIGIISMMGCFELWDCSLALTGKREHHINHAQYAYDNAEGYANALKFLIENNPSSLNPRYDEHCIEINLGLILLYETGLFGVAINWLKNIIDYLMLNVRFRTFFPLFNSDITKLGTETAKEEKSSILVVLLGEWCLVLRQLSYYQSLRSFLKDAMPELNLQLWFPDKETEKLLCVADASKGSGSTMTGINIPEDHLRQEMYIAEEREYINEEKSMGYYKHHLLFMPLLSSRHFRTYPFPNSWRGYLRTNFCFKN
ncbi:MAG: hypothetical protein R2800_03260 [Flavipsychrobacter sp.]